MSRQVAQIVEGEVEIVVDGVSEVHVFETARVVRAVPAGGGDEYIRLHTLDGFFKWNAPLDQWSTSVDADPENEPRWEPEQ